MEKKLDAFARALGVMFHDRRLFWEALTHRSYLNEHDGWPYPHNERLEYLGDAVLELAVTEYLFQRFPKSSEGELTVFRAALVNYQMLGKIATALDMGNFILMSKSEARDTGKAREVILANAFEALVGALYLDQGYSPTQAFIEIQVIKKHLDEVIRTKSYKDSKSELQEIIQERLRLTPTYRVLEESGPAHQRTFEVGVYFGEECIGKGVGSSKQEAETDAARRALLELKK